jgi:hypothetical protein
VKLPNAMYMLAGASLWVVGCASTDVGKLRARAAFEMDCSKNKLTVTSLGGNAYGVSGCGQRATYIEQCGGPGTSWGDLCIWVRNSATERSESSSPEPDDPDQRQNDAVHE